MRKILTVILLLGLSVQLVQAQIIIGGKVYGGARQADVKGSTFVNIGADHHDVLITAVYGGNDISGNIGYSETIPDSITDAIANGITNDSGDENGKGKLNENKYNTFVRISPEAKDENDNQLHNIFIGHMFGGGNGDYVHSEEGGKRIIKDKKTGETIAEVTIGAGDFNYPDVSKTYLEIKGGTVVNLYGGGNNATVTDTVDICIDNSSKVTTSITDGGISSPNLLLTEGRLTDMDIAAFGEDIVLRDTYHFSRVFGGNNRAEMRIRPTWHLIQGRIDNLYSGGNEGKMTSPVGLLLEIPENSGILVNNVYGGCRKADVVPTTYDKDNKGTAVARDDIQLPSEEGYRFPPGFSARVLVRGGDINNVYGGNDITGNVVGGNALGIYTSVRGDVYGGGNGSYPYTDNPALANDLRYGDYYFGNFKTDKGYTTSVEALNAFRPNAEMVSLRVAGKEVETIDENNEKHTDTIPTIIRGSIYVGGNSATLKEASGTKATSTLVTRPELKIGSHVIINEVFLGNNGANMIKNEEEDDILQVMNSTDKTSDGSKFCKDIDLTDKDVFAEYMKGCAMTQEPNVVFDDATRPVDPDPATYKSYTAQIGSFFCGGNVGSVIRDGKVEIPFNKQIIIYDKLVGGCNKSYVKAKMGINAEYIGGVIGNFEGYDPDGGESQPIGDKLIIDLYGLKIQPKRWKDVEKTGLTWNTVNLAGDPVQPIIEFSSFTPDDLNRRFQGGNIYGGCFESGVVNGNVIINIDTTLVDRTGPNNIFDEIEVDDESGEAVLYGHDSFIIKKRHSGVILDQQGMDVLGKALNVFGGGYGEDSEIWGSTTVNLNKGYTFQIFGGGEKGAIGKGVRNAAGKLEYKTYDARYSTTVNLKGTIAGGKRKANDDPKMAEAEFIYGGGFLASICGNTRINLDNGRIFNSFAGSCNADILGHTETYVGVNGFPYIRDHIYGGNDLGGKILGSGDFNSRVSSDAILQKVHKYDATTNANPDVLKASAYIEYQKGHLVNIFGGCYGVYDYADSHFNEYFYASNADDLVVKDANDNVIEEHTPGSARTGFCKPFLDNAFVNFRPVADNNPDNYAAQIYGAGQGYLGEREENLMQNRSYILIDIPQNIQAYQGLEVFGAGECGGVGMGVTPTDLVDHPDPNNDTQTITGQPDKASAIIDLVRGQLKNVYGGSYEEGITRRTLVNVPDGSTVTLQNIFGGAYGIRNDVACDVYESNVNWNSEDARIGGYRTGIYGGNNNARRTLYGKVNVSAPVYSYKDASDPKKDTYATVYGAGYGKDTWSEYTEVNLNGNSDITKDGARVYEVYGGGQLGKVMSAKATVKWETATFEKAQTDYDTQYTAWQADPENNSKPEQPNRFPLELGDGYTNNGLNNTLATYKYNTNVRINKGAWVSGYYYNGDLSGAYAYGGGLGSDGVDGAGDVYGTTFIGLFGGKVTKDIYAAGTVGSVNNRYQAKDDFDDSKTLTATANAHIEGGTCRNVYGGGWKGSVGYHAGDISQPYTNDVYGATNVVIGKLDGTSFVNGIPAIERNAYGGGEGGAVFGTANLTFNKGYIGYRYFTSKNDLEHTGTDTIPYLKEGTGTSEVYYQEKLNDETWKGDGTGRLNDSGCIFGGGYIDNSSVDITNVKMYGGHIRNALFGGGEIAAIGRGSITMGGVDNSERTLNAIYKAGKTSVKLYDGHVHRNVFGGGRGYNNLGEGGTLFSDGFVFGQTEVDIYGGEVGTDEGMAKGYGNVFGGGDIGYVYSAYEKNGGLCIGQKDGKRYDDQWEGYYYEREGGSYVNGEYKHPNDPTTYTDLSELEGWVMDNGEYVLSEDCKVLVEPHCLVLSEYKEEDGEHNVVSHSIESVEIAGETYPSGEYVPTSALNKLKNKNDDADKWKCLDVKGIIIHNAVFAGGNTSSGSSTVYANATTVFGNATASIHDVYHRDLITVGTGHTGGLYGDGNLTFVDGYRGLNITNYGTDYYTIEDTPEISIDQYHALDDREAAYYELRYICIKDCADKEGTNYTKGTTDGKTKASTLNADDLLALFTNDDGSSVTDGENGPSLIITSGGQRVPNPDYWKENGVCTIYAGRILNTIQRADFCGVFGSRMVMQGAQDRVPEIVDHTNYTINRVREVSLNQQHSVIASDLTAYSGSDVDERIVNEGYADIKKAIHGNYFGIYNIVNYLGGLTSDQNFYDTRITENTSNTAYKEDFTIGTGNSAKTYSYGEGLFTESDEDNASYYLWKQAHKNDRKRNNGRSHNKVALASGVYLELTTEKSTGKELNEKVWGYITGVIELDLINVQQGVGGGFVYAKNEHRLCTYNKKNHSTLTSLNADAITRKDFDYSSTQVEWETSGNFVHSSQTIIDDCYNISGKYEGSDAVPAHYWYIKGQIYVYDQYVSAYTGAPNAYSETVDIPLTITAASHGVMKLLDIKPNKYAFYKNYATKEPLGNGKLLINDVTYYNNNTISYWDWKQLSKASQELFVDSTYVTIATCKLSKDADEVFPADSVLLPEQVAELRNTLKDRSDIKDSLYHVNFQKYVPFDFIFRKSNNVSHDTGYILTYKVNNPTLWDAWYTKYESSTQEKDQTSKDDKNNYNNGPTYRLKEGEDKHLLGQREYEEGNVIAEEIHTTYQKIKNDPNKSASITAAVNAGKEQATFERAYLMTKQAEISDGKGGTVHLNIGSAVSATKATAMPDKTSEAFICNSTIQISTTEFIYLNTKMTTQERAAYINRFHEDNPLLAKEIEEHVVPAYYCTSPGYYGGDYYEKDKNYRGLAAWCSMSADDREHFVFNYDALDVLIDPAYSRAEGQKYQYDGFDFTTETQAKTNDAGYSIEQPVDYTASYSGSGFDLAEGKTVKVRHKGASADSNPIEVSSITDGDELSRTEYEKIPNEQRFYAPIKGDEKNNDTCYVVLKPLVVGSTPYAVGSTMTKDTYDRYNSSSDKVAGAVKGIKLPDHTETYYICRESYTINELGFGASVRATVASTDINNNAIAVGTEKNASDPVPVGFIISKGSSSTETYTYSSLVNKQKAFTIHGIAPTETSTFFVSRNSDIYDLSAEKIITVIYQYDYEETDGDNVTPVSERHIVNIHLQFKSGIPSVEDIRQPQTIIPGDLLGMREPEVKPGAYEVTGGGWELFETEGDAESHINGIDYKPGSDPLYWYQDGYYLAYYAKTYLGKTYSNHLPISVANYHDLKKVMSDEAKSHHYYVDNPNVKRNSKIYINDKTDGLNQLKNFFDLSLLDKNSTSVTNGVVTGNEKLNGHSLLDGYVKGGANLEFILHTDINHTDEYWTPIGSDQCFEGNFHGDGHTISGLPNSLFSNLCGSVYNLGVTGNFTSAGVADRGTGYVENCWISSSAANVNTGVYAVFGHPQRTSGTQVVNCYYPERNAYLSTTNARGNAKAMNATDFYNGTVAYNLNGFYLYKRYCDKQVTSGADYKYFTVNSDNTLSAPKPGKYGSNPAQSSAGNTTSYEYNGYVEDRFGDGDFRYAEGIIPDPGEKRAHVVTDKTEYYPIYPDDYIFFGQMLTYGWNDLRPHQATPSYVYKEEARLALNDKSNRVYRAPAYYQSKTMGVAHFNPSVNLVAYAHGDDTKQLPAYPKMTAIDFKGHEEGTAVSAYKLGFNNNFFYQPLLDDDGLVDIVNRDETPNLLVYAPSSETNSKTYGVLKTYFVDDKEPAYAETDLDGISETTPKYRCVASANTGTIVGHMVTSDKKTISDHLLVDKKDFNCPIEYSMGAGYRMWYQRLPERYVDTSKGWETVSLPFTAELVTTQQKGEITHFYSGSKTIEGSDAKIGHEYWLREYDGKKEMKEDGKTMVAIFGYPEKTGDDNDNRTAENTFLWDYYYYVNSQQDANTDTYQTYYESGRDLEQYPLLTQDMPYIIGFPGTTYREFDLSGQWVPSNTAATTPAKLDVQTITFASDEAATINVSDDMATGTAQDGYTFMPNYLNQKVTGYLMNAAGNNFTVTSEPTAVVPFRPYFITTPTATPSPAPRRTAPEYIVFDSSSSMFAIGDDDPAKDKLGESVDIRSGKRKVIVTSNLKTTADVRIFNVGGLCIANFNIEPGQTIEHPIYHDGVYVVHAAGGRYRMKLAVK